MFPSPVFLSMWKEFINFLTFLRLLNSLCLTGTEKVVVWPPSAIPLAFIPLKSPKHLGLLDFNSDLEYFLLSHHLPTYIFPVLFLPAM